MSRNTRQVYFSEQSEYMSSSPPYRDNLRDEDFDPTLQTPISQNRYRGTYETPEGRNPQGSGTIPRHLVEAIDPNKGRCLITNQDNPTQMAHILPKAITRDELAPLEWAWGLPLKDMNVNTRENFLFLRNDLHFLFDQEYWILVPSFQLLTKLRSWYTMNKPSDDQLRPGKNIKLAYVDGEHERLPTYYTYYMLPVKDMHTIPVDRVQYRASLSGAATVCDFNVYHSPYTSIRALKSHALPHYLIYDAGKKLDGQTQDVLEQISRYFKAVAHCTAAQSKAVIQGILYLYRTWTLDPPSHFLSLSTDHGSSGDSWGDREEGSITHDYQTRSRRGGGSGDSRPIIASRGGHRDQSWHRNLSDEEARYTIGAQTSEGVQPVYGSMMDYESSNFIKKSISKWRKP